MTAVGKGGNVVLTSNADARLFTFTLPRPLSLPLLINLHLYRRECTSLPACKASQDDKATSIRVDRGVLRSELLTELVHTSRGYVTAAISRIELLLSVKLDQEQLTIKQLLPLVVPDINESCWTDD
jgi:4-hydroxy-3-methylbut-2-en-1-yl diphosphate synthase IspG/GcpE